MVTFNMTLEELEALLELRRVCDAAADEAQLSIQDRLDKMLFDSLFLSSQQRLAPLSDRPTLDKPQPPRVLSSP
jgi:hypothetical protein